MFPAHLAAFILIPGLVVLQALLLPAGTADRLASPQDTLAAADTASPAGVPATGAASDTATVRFTPPIAGSWEPAPSLGQPSRWRPVVGLAYGVDPTMDDEGAGGTALVGITRDLFTPIYGALGLGAQAYVGQRGDALYGGVRVELDSPALFLHLGLDWNARSGRTDLLVGTSFPPRRSGIFARGGEIRVDWLPTRGNALQVGAVFPFRRPLAGRTRPRHVDAVLPEAPRRRWRPPPLPDAVEPAARELQEAMGWLVSLSSVFWLTENESLTYRASVEEWRETLSEFRRGLEARTAALPAVAGDGPVSLHSLQAEAYHDALELAFGRAAFPEAANDDEARALGRPLADAARQAALEEVILPYNRLVGQYRDPDTLEGLLARARARWWGWLELEGPEVADPTGARALLEAWLGDLERLRAELATLTGDGRMQWLPMALVLRPEEHRTRAQIDAIVEEAVGRPFQGGNQLFTVNAPQFQRELLRTLHETESQHILWIHDIRGWDSERLPDRTGFEMVSQGYLEALIRAVEAFDETGSLPVFTILLDQHFYELNHGRLWMDLLEDPLGHRLSLPVSHRAWEEEIRAQQARLRNAVSASRRLAAGREAFGSGWIRDVIRVQVNITNPSDFSFRSRRLLGPPIGADNLLRDHRKLVIRDLFLDDPAAGELILAGVGVGDHYADATWDDRALLLQGPAAADALEYAREVLIRNGLDRNTLPPPLRPGARAPDHAARVAALEAVGADAWVLQLHNRTGWGQKDATFVQMLLYDLAPAGSLIYVPDSLWTSFQWMAQLVAASLRGAHVLVVAPALANAPSAGFPQMSVMQELVSRLVVVEEVLGEAIREGGGDLRVGLFSREVPLDDFPGLMAEIEQTFARNPFLRELFPLPAAGELFPVLPEGGEAGEASSVPHRQDAGEASLVPHRQDAGEAGEASPVPHPREVGGLPAATPEAGALSSVPHEAGAVPNPLSRPPQMHRKTQWILDRKVVADLLSDPGITGIMQGILTDLQEAGVRPAEGGPLLEQDRLAGTLELLALHRRVEERMGRDSNGPVLYFATGSLNKNIRSMALDGEAIAVVSGDWALQSLYDLILLTGGVTWIRSLEEVEVLLPPFSNFQRRIGRWLHRVL